MIVCVLNVCFLLTFSCVPPLIFEMNGLSVIVFIMNVFLLLIFSCKIALNFFEVNLIECDCIYIECMSFIEIFLYFCT